MVPSSCARSGTSPGFLAGVRPTRGVTSQVWPVFQLKPRSRNAADPPALDSDGTPTIQSPITCALLGKTTGIGRVTTAVGDADEGDVLADGDDDVEADLLGDLESLVEGLLDVGGALVPEPSEPLPDPHA